MNLHVFLFVCLFLFILSLAQLYHLYWPHHCPPHSRAAAKMRTTVQRLLKPRSPLDCPACRLASTLSSVVKPAPVPLRPWREMKSRRGAPKRVNTEGFACPNRKCLSSGITDAHMHAASWGWHAWPCRAHPDLSLSGLPHDVHCSARHPLVPSENSFSPDRCGVGCARLVGWTLRPLSGSSAIGKPLSPAFLSRTGSHAQILHGRCFSNLQLPHLQLDELRTRLRSSQHVLWLWLAIDPLTKLVPVLHLGPRTQHAAHTVIDSLRQLLAPGCLPLFTSEGLNLYFSALTAHFGQWLARRVGEGGEHVGGRWRRA
jgi:hypothetical protein